MFDLYNYDRYWNMFQVLLMSPIDLPRSIHHQMDLKRFYKTFCQSKVELAGVIPMIYLLTTLLRLQQLLNDFLFASHAIPQLPLVLLNFVWWTKNCHFTDIGSINFHSNSISKEESSHNVFSRSRCTKFLPSNGTCHRFL